MNNVPGMYYQYSKPHIYWEEGQLKLPKEFFSPHFAHLLPQIVEMVCVMHYVNRYYIHGMHTHIHMWYTHTQCMVL